MTTDPYRPSDEPVHRERRPSIKLPRRAPGLPGPFLSSPTMSWGVYDYSSWSVIGQYPATGGNFTSIPFHRYLVALRVQDVFGIQKITLDGSGTFEAATPPDSQDTVWVAPNPLPASIPHQEFDNQGTDPQFQDLIVIMSPEIGVWEYDLLSCGVYEFGGGPTGPQEYFAVSGVMTFSGTSSNVLGRESLASLATSP